jgi:hypothetical protein
MPFMRSSSGERCVCLECAHSAGGAEFAGGREASYIPPPVPLIDALRALTSFAPPKTLPECDLALLGDVLEAHGLSPLASYQLETTRLGAGVPEGFRERLLTSYQGVLNDNLLKVVSLRGLLRDVEDVQVVLLDAVAYLDWLYPHMAFRPVGDVRAALRAEDAARLEGRGKDPVKLVRTEHGGHTAVFSDGKFTLTCQEGLYAGGPPDAPLFERATPYRVFGPRVGRPAVEEAILSTVGELASLGLHAPLVTYLDLRELLGQPLDGDYARTRAGALNLSRALHGATLVVAHLWPEVADAAAALRPPLGAAERVAVERVADAAKDPTRLRQLRGADAAARLVVAP